jgi:protein-tyrosine kinase
MTRLTDALERARLTGPAAPVESDAPPVSTDVPVTWTFDQPESQVEPSPSMTSPAPRAWEFDVPASKPGAQAEPVRTELPLPVEASPHGFSVQTAAKLVISSQPDRVLVEQYRRLAAVLHHAQSRHQTRSFMIASAVPAEGKTLTATNLALTLCRSYQKRVLLIDADLRRPSLSTIFNVSNSEGLTTSLREAQVTRLPVTQVHPNLWLLPAGRTDPNPTSLLTSEAMKQLIVEASSQFDWVILDTPPVGLMPDANLLAAMIDAAFMVVNAGRTPYTLVKKAVEAIGVDRVLGVVLNRADRSAAVEAYGYYNSYYDVAGDSRANDRRHPALV